MLGSKDMTEFTIWSRVSLPWYEGYFGLIIIYCGGSPVPCRMFNSIPGLCPLDANRNPPVVTTKNVFRHLSPIGTGEQVKSSPVENYWSREKGTNEQLSCLISALIGTAENVLEAQSRASSPVQGVEQERLPRRSSI